MVKMRMRDEISSFLQLSKIHPAHVYGCRFKCLFKPNYHIFATKSIIIIIIMNPYTASQMCSLCVLQSKRGDT